MKKSYAFLAGLALMSAFTACSNDDEMPTQMAQTNKSELVVNRVGVAELATKSGIRATSFSNQESLGLYIYRGDLTGDYNDDSRATSTVNVEYKLGTDNMTWSAPTQSIILSPVKFLLLLKFWSFSASLQSAMHAFSRPSKDA